MHHRYNIKRGSKWINFITRMNMLQLRWVNFLLLVSGITLTFGVSIFTMENWKQWRHVYILLLQQFTQQDIELYPLRIYGCDGSDNLLDIYVNLRNKNDQGEKVLDVKLDLEDEFTNNWQVNLWISCLIFWKLSNIFYYWVSKKATFRYILKNVHLKRV